MSSTSRSPLCLINVAELAYSDQNKRNQAIFERLMDEGSLFSGGIFVNPPQALGRAAPLSQRLRHLAFSPAIATPRPGIRVLDATYPLPFSWSHWVAEVQTRFIAGRIRSSLSGRGYLLWVNSAQYHPFLIARALRSQATKTIFDLSDDFTAFEGLDAELLKRNVRQMLAWSDGMVAVNAHVAAKFPHPRSIVFENATDFENFQQVDPHLVLADILPKPVQQKYVGFAGGLNRDRVDQDLLEKLLRALPEVRFVFIGSADDPALVQRLTAHPHARVLPPVAYSTLPTVIRSFDVGIVPHLDNEVTRGNDLLKIRDYLACGIPVVATAASNSSRFVPLVRVAQTADEFVKLVRGYLDGSVVHDPAPGLALARQQSWTRAVPLLADWVRGVLSQERPAKSR